MKRLTETAGVTPKAPAVSVSHGRTDVLPDPPADDPVLALAVGPLTADLCECDALCTCGAPGRFTWYCRCRENGRRSVECERCLTCGEYAPWLAPGEEDA